METWIKYTIMVLAFTVQVYLFISILGRINSGEGMTHRRAFAYLFTTFLTAVILLNFAF